MVFLLMVLEEQLACKPEHTQRAMAKSRSCQKAWLRTVAKSQKGKKPNLMVSCVFKLGFWTHPKWCLDQLDIVLAWGVAVSHPNT